MRPLVVLLLVLGALAALLFALTSIMGGPRSGAPEGVPVRPADAESTPQRSVDIVVPPSRIPEATPTEVSREALPSAPADPEASLSLAFGGIEGSVEDEDGKPIPEAKVSLINGRPNEFNDVILAMRNVAPPKPSAQAVSDESGSFRFERLDPRKEWHLVVTHDLYMREETDLIPVTESAMRQERIVMHPGVTCSGRVTEALSGRPVQGATLVVDSPLAYMSRRNSPTRMEATTDADGRYLFQNVAAGQNSLVLSAPGFATQYHPNFSLVNVAQPATRFANRQPTAALESKQQDFELEPGKIVAGTVVTPDHKGKSGVEIEALNLSGTIGSRGSAVSGRGGEFLIEGLAEGLYTVRVTSQGYDADPAQRVESGQTNVQLVLREQATVMGKVLDPEGRPMRNFTVKARTSNEISQAFGAVVGQKPVKDSADGSFELGGLPEGTYVIEGLAPGFASSFSEPFNAVQGLVTADVVVRMSRGGSLSGLVLDGQGQPLPGAVVQTRENDWMDDSLFTLFEALEPSALTHTKVATDAEGRFEIEVLTPGDYQIVINGRGYSEATVKDVKIVDNQETRVGPVTLIRGAVITGIVYGRDGRVAAGSSIQLTPADPNQFTGQRKSRADASGRYTIQNAQPGSYKLSAARGGSATGNPFEGIADMRQSEIEISIEDGQNYEFNLYMGGKSGN